MSILLSFATAAQKLLKAVAFAAGTLMLAMAAIICLDVVTRRFGIQAPGLGSTRLQELEWHLHTVVFALWIGYGYLRNVHVRVDVLVADVSLRRRMWVELIFCLLVALPFALIAFYYGIVFVAQSYAQMETSASPVGLPMRWLIKAILAVGLGLLVLAILAMISRLIVALFGPPAAASRAAADIRL